MSMSMSMPNHILPVPPCKQLLMLLPLHLWMMISYISRKFMPLCSMHQVGASESARASYRNCKETYGTKAISYLYSCVGNSLGSDLSHLKISCNCLSCIGLHLASFCSTDLLRRLNIFRITLVIIKNGDIM
jgi:hypothetical protein